MVCAKCGYNDKKEIGFFGFSFCSVCFCFAPEDKSDLEDYVSEKIDWRVIDSFRRYGLLRGVRQKKGMEKRANVGFIVCRAPLGYDVVEGKLVLNEDSVRVRELFKTFLDKNLSLNFISKQYGLSVNGLKKVLQNRTYLGEVKFDGKLNKAGHEPIISPEIFYAVQRKLKNYLRPRKYEANKYVLKGKVEPLKEAEKGNENKISEQSEKEIKINEESENLYKSVFD